MLGVLTFLGHSVCCLSSMRCNHANCQSEDKQVNVNQGYLTTRKCEGQTLEVNLKRRVSLKEVNDVMTVEALKAVFQQ